MSVNDVSASRPLKGTVCAVVVGWTPLQLGGRGSTERCAATPRSRYNLTLLSFPKTRFFVFKS